MYKVRCEIQGISDLLQHRHPFPEETMETKKRTGDQDYSYEFELSKYALEDGRLYQPSEHILSALTKAAVNFKIPGARGKTYKDIIKASVFITPDNIPHKNQTCEKHRCWVKIQKASVIRERPLLKNWGLEFTIIATDDQLNEKSLRDILTFAGTGIGIGDWRPRFGRFEVTKFEKLNGVSQ